MALIAATAIGLSLARTYSLAVLHNDLKPNPFLPRVMWAYMLAVLPVPALWSIALFGLSLRRPRPDWRRLIRRPGFVACGAVTLVSLIRLLGFLTLVVRTLGNPYCTTYVRAGEIFSVTVSYPGPVNVATVCISSLCNVSSSGRSGQAVAAAWLLLVASGRWRSEPAWLDRLGRGLGAYWIGIIPFSCWWDYHILY